MTMAEIRTERQAHGAINLKRYLHLTPGRFWGILAAAEQMHFELALGYRSFYAWRDVFFTRFVYFNLVYLPTGRALVPSKRLYADAVRYV